MTGNEIRKKYLEFMAKSGHAVIPSAGLVPDNDPTTLFTGSGMQPLVPYLMGESHPKGVRLANSQKCFRAEDIEEVGDNRHTTFFEMLGNWSLGDYFKEEQIRGFWKFLTEELKLDPSRIFVTCYIGNPTAEIPKDTESAQIWKELFAEQGIIAKEMEIGSEEQGYEVGEQGGRIFYYSDKNWWSRVGAPHKMPVGEPGGPDTEVFYLYPEIDHDAKWGKYCHPNCDCGRYIELGNSVFMQYVKTNSGFDNLPKKNVDYGGGLERITAASNNVSDVFKTDLFWNVIQQLERLSGKTYDDNREAFRVITDHIRGGVFMIGDEILPGNSEQGYFVRRLLRRSVRYADLLGVPAGELKNLAESVINTYSEQYPNLSVRSEEIKSAIATEEEQFRRTLDNGLKQFNKISLQIHMSTKEVNGKKVLDKESAVAKQAISAQNAFDLFTTYGFPVELTEEIAHEKGLVVDRVGFEKLMVEHREKSRVGAEHKFKGGLADNSEKVVQYHTTTHLMLAGLRDILGTHVHQAGSNITGERLRYDFNHPEKIDPETLAKIENWVNNALDTGGEVTIENMSKEQAQADSSIEGSFWDRYPDEVKVYTVRGNDGRIFSRELCGGPHVSKIEDISGRFKIVKEESSSAGIRRIKAVLE
jgi:alanyl-tRNA synthetase